MQEQKTNIFIMSPKYGLPKNNLIEPRQFEGLHFALRPSWEDRSDDYVAVIAGHVAGRIMLTRMAFGVVNWHWFMTGPYLPRTIHSGTGICDTLQEAKSEFRVAFNRWLEWAVLQNDLVTWYGAHTPQSCNR
jgi:hypothetical protein